MSAMRENGVALRGNRQLHQLGRQPRKTQDFDAGEIIDIAGLVHIPTDAVGFPIDLPRDASEILRAEALPQRGYLRPVVVSETAPEAGNSHSSSALEARSALVYHFRHRWTFLEAPDATTNSGQGIRG
jgi:hypothetical protein